MSELCPQTPPAELASDPDISGIGVSRRSCIFVISCHVLMEPRSPLPTRVQLPSLCSLSLRIMSSSITQMPHLRPSAMASCTSTQAKSTPLMNISCTGDSVLNASSAVSKDGVKKVYALRMRLPMYGGVLIKVLSPKLTIARPCLQ